MFTSCYDNSDQNIIEKKSQQSASNIESVDLNKKMVGEVDTIINGPCDHSKLQLREDIYSDINSVGNYSISMDLFLEGSSLNLGTVETGPVNLCGLGSFTYSKINLVYKEQGHNIEFISKDCLVELSGINSFNSRNGEDNGSDYSRMISLGVRIENCYLSDRDLILNSDVKWYNKDEVRNVDSSFVLNATITADVEMSCFDLNQNNSIEVNEFNRSGPVIDGGSVYCRLK